MTKTSFQIIASYADGARQVHQVSDGESIIVGRSQTRADLVIQDPAISRSHLRLECVDGTLFAENLSPQGASLDGGKIDGRVAVNPGQTLTLGKNVSLSFVRTDGVRLSANAGGLDSSSSERTIFDSGERTSEGTNGSGFAHTASGSSASPSRLTLRPVSPSNDRMGTNMKTNLEWQSHPPLYNPDAFEGTIEQGTMIRPITSPPPQKKRTVGMERFIIFAVILAVVGVMTVLLGRKPPPPPPVSWPLDENGLYLDEKFTPPSGGYSVIYPHTDHAEKQQTSDSGFVVEYKLQRVPFRLWYNEINLGKHAFADGSSVETLWKNILPGKENWNFEKSLELPIFVGDEQGIPLTVMEYYRVGAEGRIMGVAQLIRYGAVLGSVCIEILERDQLRAEHMLMNYYILVEPEKVLRHWQGDGKPLRSESAVELLKLAKHELTRDAPLIWEQVEALLLDTVRKAFFEQNQEISQEALDLLASLRSRKTTWFHEQKLKKMNFERRENAEQVEAITRLCQLVFSSPNDQRFYEVRNW